MLRSVLYGVQSGLAEIRRMPVLVSVTVLMVGLATVLILMSSGLNELTEVGTAAITADAAVVVFLSAELTDDDVARAEGDLASIPGVDRVRTATPSDVASTQVGHEVGSDISKVRTLLLNGSVSQSEVVVDARLVEGAEKVEAGVGERADWLVSLLEMVMPWLAGLFGIAGLALIINLTFAAARTRRAEATVMRLLGANWPHLITSVGTVVVVPVVTTVMVVTVIVSMTWPTVLRAIAPESAGMAAASSVFSTGMLLAVVAAGLAIGFTQLGIMTVRRRSRLRQRMESSKVGSSSR